MITLRRPGGAYAAPQAFGAPAAERSSAAGGVKFLRQKDEMPDITGFRNRLMKIPPLILRRPAPYLRRGAGAPCLASPSASLRLPSGRCQARALSPSGTPAARRSAFVAPQAGRPSLRSGLGLASQLRKPFRLRFALPLVLLRLLRSHLWCLLAALGALPPRSDFRLARRRSPRAFFLSFPYPPARAQAPAGIQALRFAFLCHSRKAVSPSMFKVDERKSKILNRWFGVRYSSAIYRAHLIIAPGMGAVMRRRGGRWRRFKHKITNQVLFYLPITALTILAIATAMPSDGRLCSRQK